jgi:hypothetical protein
MSDQPYRRPEPVPYASQIAVLPFAAAVDGYLREKSEVPGLRVTLHRTMSQKGHGYLQQICPYLTGGGIDAGGTAGRIFPVNEGIMGEAYRSGCIWRTKKFATVEHVRAELRRSMPAAGDPRKAEEVALSYLAIPFLGPPEGVVLILYADCNQLNFFADDDRVARVAAMCRGLCRLFDSLQKEPFPNLRNFPLQRGHPTLGNRTSYENLHESLDTVEPPELKEVRSFNYEAAAA